MDNNTYSFDKNGDIDSGYDVILWKETSPSMLDTNNVVGHYDIKNQMLTFEKKQDLYNLTVSICLSLPSYFTVVLNFLGMKLTYLYSVKH